MMEFASTQYVINTYLFPSVDCTGNLPVRSVYILSVAGTRAQGAAAETMAQMWMFVRVAGSVGDELGDVLFVNYRFFRS